MKTKLIELLIVLLLLFLVGLCFAGWDNDKPADSDAWNDAAGYIRDNWDAMEVIFGADLAGATGELVVNDVNAADIITLSPWIDARAHGVTGDGSDESTVIQAAFDASGVAGLPVLFPAGTYKFGTTLTITSDYTSILGINYPYMSAVAQDSTLVGTVFEYTGTSGTAIEIGVDIGGLLTDIHGIRLERFHLRLHEDTDIGIRIWNDNGGLYKNINIFGSSQKSGADTDTCAIKVEASQNTLFEHINIMGQGTASAGSYLARGIWIATDGTNGCTTTTYNKVYIHYCEIGNYQETYGDFYDCIFEANNDRGAMIGIGADGCKFTNCWFEANTYNAYFTPTARVWFDNTLFNIGSNQDHFKVITTSEVDFKNCTFASSHANPQLFDDATFTTGQVRFNFCNFSASTTLFSGADLGNWDQIKFTDMDVAVYHFIKQSIATSATIAMPIAGYSGTHFTMPQDGNLIGANVHSVNTYTSGTFAYNVEINDVDKIVVAAHSAASDIQDENFLEYTFSAGDTISVDFTTASYVPNGSGEDFIVEVIVAFGRDGVK